MHRCIAGAECRGGTESFPAAPAPTGLRAQNPRRPWRAAPLCAGSDRASARGRAHIRDRWQAVRSDDLPACAVPARSRSIAGHGASGLTWSGVTGDTPPQSLMPAAISSAVIPGLRLGGAWMFICGPSTIRAIATVHSSSSASGSGACAMPVPCLARKFWTMTSWMCPWRAMQVALIASSESIRSVRVSPMPIRMPVVSGTCIRPAASMVASRDVRPFVGRAMMRAAALAKPRRSALQHDALRHRHAAERGDLGLRSSRRD